MSADHATVHPSRRFLRARRFDLGKSYEMYMASKKWREEHSIDTLYANFDYLRARKAFSKFFPSYLHKFDRTGSPVHVHELSKIDLNGVGSWYLLLYMHTQRGLL